MGPPEREHFRLEDMVLVCLNILHLVSYSTRESKAKILIFETSIPSGGISNFGPLIVQSFGFDR